MLVLVDLLGGLAVGAVASMVFWCWWKDRPLFRCSGCHRDIYPPAYKRLHVGLATYCAECEAKYWQEAEALRARMK